MASTTSGTTTFNLDVDDILEEALDPLGGQWFTGVDAEKARRTLNLILIQLQNKNIPLNKLDTITTTTAVGTSTYDIDSSVSDILELTIEDPDNGFEVALDRESARYFHDIPNKDQSNRPTLWSTDRKEDGVNLKFWPVPDKAYTVSMLVSKRIEDVTAAFQKLDISYRYLPLIVKWLSYELSLKKMDFPTDQKQLLKMEYVEAMVDAFEEDRERADMFIKPGGISGK